MIRCWVATELGGLVYAVMYDYGEFVELDENGVLLLAEFVKVLGVEDEEIRIAVFSDYRTFYDVYELYMEFSDEMEPVGAPKFEWMKSEGYYIPEEGKGFENFDPNLAIRYGIKVCVTDKGRLMYLDSCGKERVILGDICSRLYRHSIHHDDKTVFVFDDRIVECDESCYARPSDCHSIRIDSYNLTNSAVRSALSKQRWG